MNQIKNSATPVSTFLDTSRDGRACDDEMPIHTCVDTKESEVYPCRHPNCHDTFDTAEKLMEHLGAPSSSADLRDIMNLQTRLLQVLSFLEEIKSGSFGTMTDAFFKRVCNSSLPNLLRFFQQAMTDGNSHCFLL